LDPRVIDALSKITSIPVFDLVAGMGYPLRSGYSDDRVPQLIEDFEASPELVRRAALAMLRAAAEPQHAEDHRE
jgi:hypothetical protein